jgi:hypothetical protein
VKTLSGRELAVVHRGRFSQSAGGPGPKLGKEGDLRLEEEGSIALVDRFLRGGQIHLGFPGSRWAKKQEFFALSDPIAYRCHRGFLFFRQFHALWLLGVAERQKGGAVPAGRGFGHNVRQGHP